MSANTILTHLVRHDWLIESPLEDVVTTYIEVLRSQRYANRTIRIQDLPQSWWVIIAPFRRDKAQVHPGGSKSHRGIVACSGIRGHTPSSS